MKNIEKLQTIKNSYSSDTNMLLALKGILVDAGLITRADLANILNANTDVLLCDPAQVALVYLAIYNKVSGKGMTAPEEFFTPMELDAARSLETSSPIKGDECVFNDCFRMSPNKEFGCFITLEQIYQLAQSRQVRILSEMQRETELVHTKMMDIPCVHFMPDKMNAISQNWIDGKQHPNTIRFHVLPEIGDTVEDCFDYDEDKHILTIKKGIIANIDGNHRMNAIVDAVSKNKRIAEQFRMGLIISFGNASIAREIITQEEERTPIDREHISSMQAVLGNQIVQKISQDEDYPELLKVCTTSKQFSAGLGRIVQYCFAEAITESFKLPKSADDMSLLERRKLEEYLLMFLSQYAFYVEKKEPGYLKSSHLHAEYIMSNEYTIYGLMDVAAAFRNSEDWDTALDLFVEEIDLHETSGRKYTNPKLYSKKYVAKFVKELEGDINE